MNRKCYAKINLTLDSLYERPDSYHEIDTIMARISLFDELAISPNGTNYFNYSSNIPDLCPLEDNLVYKAWSKMKESIENPGVDVRLIKNIPLAAGLAGGSTDAAEMIKALNELWELNLSKEEMMDIGKFLGADIPFFFEESFARATGIGEILRPFENKLDMNILLINDLTEISSAEIYKNLKDYGHIDNDAIVTGLINGDKEVIKSFENVMEEEIFKLYPHLRLIIDKLRDLGAENALVSGSGASIFGVFTDSMLYDRAYKSLVDTYSVVEKVRLIDG